MPITEKELNEEGKNRTILHESLDNGLETLIGVLAVSVYEMYKSIINELQTDDKGFLLNVAANRNIRAKEIPKIKEVDVEGKLKKQVVKGFGILQKNADNYFGKDDPKGKNAKKKRIRLRDKIYKGLLADYGLSNKYSVIDDMMNADDIYRKARLQILNAVFYKQTRLKAIDQINNLIVKDETLKRHFHTSIKDIYSQFDRSLHEKTAEATGYKYAIYQGGLISTSRKFCKVRNRKVFTLQEINKFGKSSDKFGGYTNKSSGMFAGKNKNYNPLRDAGGHNCRHFYSYISEKLAFRMRPSLKPTNDN